MQGKTPENSRGIVPIGRCYAGLLTRDAASPRLVGRGRRVVAGAQESPVEHVTFAHTSFADRKPLALPRRAS